MDDRLRQLFQAAGPLVAADGLEARVLARLDQSPASAPALSQPLVSRWAWLAAAAAVALLLTWGVLSGPEGTSVRSFPWPELDVLRSLTTSRWTLMGMLCGALLLLLDTMLDRRRATVRAA